MFFYKKNISIKSMVISILLFVAALPLAALGAEDFGASKRAAKKSGVKSDKDTIDARALIASYKPIRGTLNGNTRPRMLAVVLMILAPDAKDGQQAAAIQKLHYFEGFRLIVLYTPRGWSVFPIAPEFNAKQHDVVEVVFPAANDFRDMSSVEKVRTDLAELRNSGAYGVQRVRPDCVADMSDMKNFFIACNNKKVTPLVINAAEFKPGALNWLIPPVGLAPR